MASRLSVIFYILLCLEVGVVLTVLPWYHPFGLSDWADNYFLLYAAQKTGMRGLQHAVSSGWFRGAVSGLGIINLAMAVWEMLHFNQTVRALEGSAEPKARVRNNARATEATVNLPDNQRRDEQPNHQRV
jgi:hypothetical protein